jgi:hypothetical protein
MSRTPPGHRPYALFKPREKPFLIWAAPPFLLFWGLSSAAFVVLVAISAFGNEDGATFLSGIQLTRSQTLLIALPIGLVGGVLNVVAAYGLVVERPWVRSLQTKWSAVAYGIIFVVLLALMPSRATGTLLSVIPNVLFLAVNYWFFYSYKPVVEYYRKLEARRK